MSKKKKITQSSYPFQYTIPLFVPTLQDYKKRSGLKKTTKDQLNKVPQNKKFVKIQAKGTADPSSNPSVCHLVLDPLIQTLVARTKANAN